MRILVIEDDADLAQFLRKGLEEEQHTVETAADGETGLILAMDDNFDLLVVDVMLPKLDGLTLCRRLREKDKRTPILLLTARDAVEDKVAGLDAGADDYLTKPFAFTELVARVRALLRRGGPHAGSRLKAKDLEMDPASRRVWRGGKEIALTSKEFALLEYLLRNRDIVLTRTAILERVWGLNYDPMTNVVDVYIRSLRVKIDRDFTSPLIATVRGVGYKLETGE